MTSTKLIPIENDSCRPNFEIKDSLLVLQHAQYAISTILDNCTFNNDSITPNLIQLLQAEIYEMNCEIERLHQQYSTKSII